MPYAHATSADLAKGNEAIVRRLAAAANTGDLTVLTAALDESFASDVRMMPPLSVAATGIEALQQVWADLLTAFPDIRVTIEVLGALGLVVPAAVGVAVVLTPLAATGLALVLVLAAGFHVRRKELPAVAVTVVLLLPVALVIWGRFGPYAF